MVFLTTPFTKFISAHTPGWCAHAYNYILRSGVGGMLPALFPSFSPFYDAFFRLWSDFEIGDIKVVSRHCAFGFGAKYEATQPV